MACLISGDIAISPQAFFLMVGSRQRELSRVVLDSFAYEKEDAIGILIASSYPSLHDAASGCAGSRPADARRFRLNVFIDGKNIAWPNGIPKGQRSATPVVFNVRRTWYINKHIRAEETRIHPCSGSFLRNHANAAVVRIWMGPASKCEMASSFVSATGCPSTCERE